MVFENDIPYLRYFHVRTVVRGKSEPIGTDNGSCMYDAVIAYHAIVIYFYSRIDDSSHPYFYIVADIGLWIDFTPFAEDCIFSDICKGSYVYRLGKYGRRCNMSSVFDTFFLGTSLIDHVQQHGKAGVCIVYFDKCGFYFVLGNEAFVYQYDAGLCCIYVGGVFWIGEKCQCPGFSFFYFRQIVYFYIFVPDNFSV